MAQGVKVRITDAISEVIRFLHGKYRLGAFRAKEFDCHQLNCTFEFQYISSLTRQTKGFDLIRNVACI